MRRIVNFIKGSPLVFLFFLITLAYGVGFTFFGETRAVGKSSLFMAMNEVSQGIAQIWGVFAVLVVVGCILASFFRKKLLSSIATVAGFMLWLFATIIYGVEENWLTMISVSFPSMCFWGLLYVGFVTDHALLDPEPV